MGCSVQPLSLEPGRGARVAGRIFGAGGGRLLADGGAWQGPRQRPLLRGKCHEFDLAQRIGVTRQTIIAIEQGRYSPSLEMAFQIARVIRVPLEAVFQYSDSEGEAS